MLYISGKQKASEFFNEKNVSRRVSFAFLFPVFVLIVCLGVFSNPYKTSAQENTYISEMMMLLNQLQAQINELSRSQSANTPITAKNNVPKKTVLPFSADLSYGMRGNNEVKRLQEFLKNDGYDIGDDGPTGNYLSLTREAVEAYQENNGLPTTGYFGPLTRKSVNKVLFPAEENKEAATQQSVSSFPEVPETKYPIASGGKFSIGFSVATKDKLNVRSAPSASATIFGEQPADISGVIKDGPVSANGYLWWRVDYESGPDGWSAESLLRYVN